MPEGPSLVILKEEVQQFKGKKVLEVSGNSKIDQSRLLNKKVVDFQTWGKHFLICFKDFTVRVHFLLFGKYLINDRKPATPRLSLRFANGELNFYTAAIILFEENPESLYDFSSDVMNEKWDAAKAMRKLKSNPDMLVCDALLKQEFFAGVGNIIKNEVLYRQKIHPASKVGALPPKQLKAMVNDARDYSFLFLEWKKKFELKKHWEAHTKKTCQRCNLPIIKEYMGTTNRRTFFCKNCQVLYE
jgi:endonuclease VIII